MKRIFTVLALLVICNYSWAQQKKIDSLLTKIDKIYNFEQFSIAEVELFAIPGGDLALLKKARHDLAVARANAAPEKEARALLMICNATFTMHDLPELLDASLKGISVSRAIHNNFYLSRFLRMVALANVYAQDSKKSASYSLQAANVAMMAGDVGEAINNYSNLESDYAEFKMPDSAIFYARLEFKLLPKVKSRNKWDYEQTALGDLGEALVIAGKPDSALAYYRLAYDISKRHIQSPSLPYMENNIARIYLDKAQLDSAKKYALISYEQASKNKIWEFTADAANILRRVYQGHDDKQTIFYLKAEMAAKDSINAADKLRQFRVIVDKDRRQREDLKLEQDKFNTRIRFYAVISAAVVLLITGFLLWRTNRRQKHNNQLLSEQKEEISAQRDHLEDTLNQLKATQAQLIQSEKMASLGELTAGIAHEIQNPLNFVNNFAEVNLEMLEELKANSEKPKAEGDDQAEKALLNDLIENEKKIRHHGKRADFIVKGMLQHSRVSTGERQLTNLNVLADEFLKLSYHGLRAKDKGFNAEMITHFDNDLPKVNIAQQEIGRVLLNMFNNAFYAVSQLQKTAGPDYKPGVVVSTAAADGHVIISIKDNGGGIPDAIKDKIMQPFFTTKPTGEGTGLGLSLSYDIVVKGHGGNINVESKEGEGAEFTVTLPK